MTRATKRASDAVDAMLVDVGSPYRVVTIELDEALRRVTFRLALTIEGRAQTVDSVVDVDDLIRTYQREDSAST